jgi:hypothetical protein
MKLSLNQDRITFEAILGHFVRGMGGSLREIVKSVVGLLRGWHGRYGHESAINPAQQPLNCRAWHCCVSGWASTSCAGVMGLAILS